MSQYVIASWTISGAPKAYSSASWEETFPLQLSFRKHERLCFQDHIPLGRKRGGDACWDWVAMRISGLCLAWEPMIPCSPFWHACRIHKARLTVILKLAKDIFSPDNLFAFQAGTGRSLSLRHAQPVWLGLVREEVWGHRGKNLLPDTLQFELSVGYRAVTYHGKEISWLWELAVKKQLASYFPKGAINPSQPRV